MLNRVRNWLRSHRRPIVTASSVAVGVLVLRSLGALQWWEWAALDQLFRLRPPQLIHTHDDRLVVVGVDEDDLRRYGWPVPDEILSQALRNIDAQQPRAIGLDIYRDLPAEPGGAELAATFEEVEEIIGIERISSDPESRTDPPPVLDRLDRVGFNNTIIDGDGRVRRGILYARSSDGQPHNSFALALALRYLEEEEILPKPAPSGDLQLGKLVVPLFKPNDGPYVGADTQGYQFFANFRGFGRELPKFSLSDIVEGNVSPDWARDRVVLIGATASSLKDFFPNPYSGSWWGAPREIPGVVLQADFVSQLLAGALEGRSTIRTWNDPMEWSWILLWSGLGAGLSWGLHSSRKSLGAAIGAGVVLASSCYGAFLLNWWIPLVPPLLGLTASSVAIIAHFARLEEEWKKSKEFFFRVINAIPDPIFVKDSNHHLVVVNEAYCKLLGYPADKLLDGRDRDFLPSKEGNRFWMQDEQVLREGIDLDTEEEFTTADGTRLIIHVKRSLHPDRAGNRFLVAVIHDITERKKLADTLEHQAHHDDLTGLPNRKLFLKRLREAIDWARGCDANVALLFLDLDGFKKVNDTLGHATGDLLLEAAAKRLAKCFRSSDTVARLGGDEFTVILPGIPDVEVAARVADKAIYSLSEPFEIGDRQISVTTSIGISLYPLHGTELDVLIVQADNAMYRAKTSGKNRYELTVDCSVETEIEAEARDSSLMAPSISNAVDRNEIA